MSDARKKAPKTHKRPTRADATPHAIQRAHRVGEHGHGAALVVAGKGPGVPLAPAAQRRLDAHLGHRFSALRIHTDDFAARTARALDANAFTVGRDVFFSAGRYTPDEPAGYARLAHEAAHTVQQRSSTATLGEGRLEAEADRAVLAGSTAVLSATSPMIQREPTWPRRTTGAAMLREAERILATARDPKSTDELTKLWSQVGSNFPATPTAGTIARRVWTHLFLRHFTEPDPRGGVESSHPRYFYSKAYGWVDGQHFFGFIDFAEQQLAATPTDPDAAFAAATAEGIKIEDRQQKIRDWVILGAPPAQNPTWRLMQVRPPNTSLFRSPQMVAGAAAYQAANLATSALLTGRRPRSSPCSTSAGARSSSSTLRSPRGRTRTSSATSSAHASSSSTGRRSTACRPPHACRRCSRRFRASSPRSASSTTRTHSTGKPGPTACR